MGKASTICWAYIDEFRECAAVLYREYGSCNVRQESVCEWSSSCNNGRAGAWEMES